LLTPFNVSAKCANILTGFSQIDPNLVAWGCREANHASEL
jgi:hypothetical protein